MVTNTPTNTAAESTGKMTVCWVTGSEGTGISEQSRVVVNALNESDIDIVRIATDPLGIDHSKPYIQDESGLVYPTQSLTGTILAFEPDLVMFHNASATARQAASSVQPHAVTVARLGINLREQLFAGTDFINHIPDIVDFTQSVDHVVASSNRVTRTLRSHGVSNERITRIPTAIDTSNPTDPEAERHPAPGSPPNPDAPTVGLIGRVGAIKNQFVAIEGLSGLRSDAYEPTITPNLLMAGSTNSLDSFPQRLPEILPHFAPNFRTQMLGHVADPMADFYPCLDIHAHPSWTENCPQTILEAAVAGVPSVVSDLAWADAYPELDFPRCAPDDPIEWTETFHDLLTDDERRIEIARQQQQAVLDNYSIEDVAYEYLDLFEQLLDDHAAFKFSSEVLAAR